MRLIFDRSGEGSRPVDHAALIELYRHPAPETGAWLRTNFVTTLDGSIQGPDGRSGSINTSSDQEIFALHRALADAVIVAGGTARNEGYRSIDLAPWQQELRLAEGLAPDPTLVIISGSANIDPVVASPREGEGGPVMIITTTGKPAASLAPLRDAGVEIVELDPQQIDLARVVDDLAGRGLARLLCEGGPTLHRDLLAAGLVDELSLTLSPLVVGGEGRRTTAGAALPEALDFRPRFALLAEDGTLFTSYQRA